MYKVYLSVLLFVLGSYGLLQAACAPFSSDPNSVTGSKCHRIPDLYANPMMMDLTMDDVESDYYRYGFLRYVYGPYEYPDGVPTRGPMPVKQRGATDGTWDEQFDGGRIAANGFAAATTETTIDLFVNGTANVDQDASFDYARSISRESITYVPAIPPASGNILLTPNDLRYNGNDDGNHAWNHITDPVRLKLTEEKNPNNDIAFEAGLFKTNFEAATPIIEFEDIDGPASRVASGPKPTATWNGMSVALSDYAGARGYWDVTLGSQQFEVLKATAPSSQPIVGDTLRIRFDPISGIYVDVSTGVFRCSVATQAACPAGTFLPDAALPISGTTTIDVSASFAAAGITLDKGRLNIPFIAPNGYDITEFEIMVEAVTENYAYPAIQTFSVNEAELLQTIELTEDNQTIVIGGAPYTPFALADSTPMLPAVRDSSSSLNDHDQGPYAGELVLTPQLTPALAPSGITIDHSIGDGNQFNAMFDYRLSPTAESVPRNGIELRFLPVNTCGAVGVPSCTVDWFQSSPQGLGIRIEGDTISLIGGTESAAIPDPEDWHTIMVRVEKDTATTARVQVWGDNKDSTGRLINEIVNYEVGADKVRMAFAGMGSTDNLIDEIVGRDTMLQLVNNLNDVNVDGVINVEDRSSLEFSLQNGGRIADYNMDGERNSEDFLFYVEDVLSILPGDLDGGGSVAFADFLVLSDNFGREGAWPDGDLDADGEIGFSDFLILSGNFGKSQAAVAVPEPGITTSLLVAFLGVGQLRRRRPSRCTCSVLRS